MLKNRYGLCMLYGYGHALLIVRNKHQWLIKENQWWCTIMVCAQAVKNESKQECKHPYVSIAKGMKSLFGACLIYDHVFSWATIITTCVVIVDTRWTISMQVGSAMMTSIKVQKPSLVIRISNCHWMWWGKRWETPFWTCAPFSKTIVMIISQSVLWVVVCSFL
jgi:hypothetical protein